MPRQRTRGLRGNSWRRLSVASTWTFGACSISYWAPSPGRLLLRSPFTCNSLRAGRSLSAPIRKNPVRIANRPFAAGPERRPSNVGQASSEWRGPLSSQRIRRWTKADSNPWSLLHRRRLRDRPWRLVRIRVPAGETNSFTGGTDGSNPLSSSGESAANFVFGREAWKGPRRRRDLAR
jgi:hypothetical protein